MKYLQSILENESVRSTVQSADELTTLALETIIPLQVEGNIDLIHENLDVFVTEDIDESFEDIVDFSQEDSLELTSALSELMAESSLTLEDKEHIIVESIEDYLEEMKFKPKVKPIKGNKGASVLSNKDRGRVATRSALNKGNSAKRTSQAGQIKSRKNSFTGKLLGKVGLKNTFAKGGFKGVGKQIGANIQKRLGNARTNLKSAGKSGIGGVKKTFNNIKTNIKTAARKRNEARQPKLLTAPVPA